MPHIKGACIRCFYTVLCLPFASSQILSIFQFTCGTRWVIIIIYFFTKNIKHSWKNEFRFHVKKNYFLPQCLAYIDRFLTEASRLLTRSRGIGKWWFYYCETIVMFDPNQIPSIIPDNITINVKLKIYIIIYQLLWLTFDYLLSI